MRMPATITAIQPAIIDEPPHGALTLMAGQSAAIETMRLPLKSSIPAVNRIAAIVSGREARGCCARYAASAHSATACSSR